MTTKVKLKIVAAVAALLLAIFLPQVVSAGWHLMHGRTVDYRSWKVVVPSGWYAMSHGEGMSVERMAELPWQEHPVANFLPVHFAKTYSFQYDVFQKAQDRTMRAMGYLPLWQRDIQVAGQEGRCWTYNNWKDRKQLWIACIVPKDFTSADYHGTQAYADDFFSLLTQTQRKTN
jgi:hypothetical protein